MLINPQNLSLTLFVSVLISLAVTSVEAHDFAQPNRRDHDNLKRLIRKRSPQLGLINVVQDPNKPTDPNAGDLGGDAAAGASASASAQSASASAPAVSDSASAAVSNSASNSASVASLSASGSVSASVSASASSASASSVSAPAKSSTTTPVAQSSQAAQTPDPNAAQNDNDNVSHPQSTVTRTNSVLAAAETNNPSPPPPQSAAAQKKSTITTILIVVAASVGGVAILWTVFRKWKLGHSKKFDERMAPIDWQPTNDEGIIPAHRRANSRASSFTSSAAHGAGYNDRLDHDFTAPASHLAPVGGYADLARGPSPQPQMQEAYGQGLARGPSTTRPAYDTSVPLHHQAGYGQAEAYDYNGDAIRF